MKIQYDTELYHHGIKGQKWGVRRFQPYSYTGPRKGGKIGKEIGLAGKKAGKAIAKAGAKAKKAGAVAAKKVGAVGKKAGAAAIKKVEAYKQQKAAEKHVRNVEEMTSSKTAFVKNYDKLTPEERDAAIRKFADMQTIGDMKAADMERYAKMADSTMRMVNSLKGTADAVSVMATGKTLGENAKDRRPLKEGTKEYAEYREKLGTARQEEAKAKKLEIEADLKEPERLEANQKQWKLERENAAEREKIINDEAKAKKDAATKERQEAAQKRKETIDKTVDKAKEAGAKAKDVAKDVGGKAKEAAKEAGAKAKEASGKAKEASAEAVKNAYIKGTVTKNYYADKAKSAAKTASETAQAVSSLLKNGTLKKNYASGVSVDMSFKKPSSSDSKSSDSKPSGNTNSGSSPKKTASTPKSSSSMPKNAEYLNDTMTPEMRRDYEKWLKNHAKHSYSSGETFGVIKAHRSGKVSIRYDTELYHHGILGQKWGVRRFQNKNGSLTPKGKARYTDRRKAGDLVAKTIPAGTKCFRISTKGEAGVINGKDAYVAYLPVDRNNIRAIAPWLMAVRGKTIDDAYERELEITKDINLAPYEEVAAIRRELMGKEQYRAEAAMNMTDNVFRQYGYDMDTMTAVKDVYTGKKSLDQIANEQFESRKANYADDPTMTDWINRNQATLVNDIKNDFANGVHAYGTRTKETEAVLKAVATKKMSEVSDSDRQYANMVMTAVYGNDGLNKEALRNELKKRGYDGMYDNAMISVDSANGQEAYEPIIVFDGGGSMKETSGRSLTRREIANARTASDAWRTKVELNRVKTERREFKAKQKELRTTLKNRKKQVDKAWAAYKKEHPGTRMNKNEFFVQQVQSGAIKLK